MNVLLISPKVYDVSWNFETISRLAGVKTAYPPLGLITVAALLPSHWTLRLVDLNAEVLTEDTWNWADTVMISANVGQREGMLSLIRECKERGKTSIVGGTYPTMITQEVKEAGPDFLVKGEAENSIDLLLSALEEGKTGGIFSNEIRPDLCESPIPRYDLLTLDYYLFLQVQTSRGCPFNCDFCDVSILYGRKYRHKPSDRVIMELETIYNLGWKKEILFSDDNFIGSKKHTKELLEKMITWRKGRSESTSYWAEVTVDLAEDQELMDLMTEAGFRTVILGVETPDEEALKLSGKLHNLKNDIKTSITSITRNGLGVVAFFIIGLDGEKKGAGDRICALVEKANIPMVFISLLQPLPETALWKRLKGEGRLLQKAFSIESGRIYMKADVWSPDADLLYVPTRPRAEIFEEYGRIYAYLYEPSRYFARIYRHVLATRPTRRAMALSRGEPVPEPKKPPSMEKAPVNVIIRDTKALLWILWRHGVLASYRVQFWRQLAGVWRYNRSRMRRYILWCIMSEEAIRIRGIMKDYASQRLARGEQEP